MTIIRQDFDNRELANEEENNDLCEALGKPLEEMDASSTVQSYTGVRLCFDGV